MNDIAQALAASVADACARHSDTDAVTASADGGWNPRLWTALEQIGVTTVSVPEEHGGSGGDTAAAVAVLTVLGRYSAGVPLAETALLAGWLLAGCGAPLPDGPLTAAVAGDGLRLHREGGPVVAARHARPRAVGSAVRSRRGARRRPGRPAAPRRIRHPRGGEPGRRAARRRVRRRRGSRRAGA
ncbi:hypothetical protein EAS64_26120 [Trebonia kvetii]|uniref:Acyl-CoA dehydrogenase/oxidase N-terminal domain-containing protein n=1 Tax=Trebonia kvetii TaxID=2480626 RepID=A0A6P2BVX9_9ACTN|nr:acyl-CoA dehydrogenase family protein [Trebonia kvetii]TVZ02295.1 hypothetical protein EAS64_26120 [Trebonia kvetii]